MSDSAGRYVGIDLGTTFSAIAFVDAQGTPITVKNRDDQPVTPSVVLIGPDREVLVGERAREAGVTRPDLIARNFKRDMGDKFYHRHVGGREFSPEALSAIILRRLREDFEDRHGPVAGVVITVPAYFGDARRRAAQDAGRIAGLNVIDIINEPTAAALANAFRQYLAAGGSTTRFEAAAIAATAPSTTLVFDLGGGTFDVTIIRINGEKLNVLATGGDVRLGGLDFDKRLADTVADDFVRHHGTDPRDNDESFSLLLTACEKAKIELSTSKQVAIQINHLGRHMAVPVKRERFDDLTADLITRMQMSVETLLEDALLTWDRIDDVLLVGGSSRMPMIHQMLERISGKRPNMATAPEQIVAHGAAIHAAITQMSNAVTNAAPDGTRTVIQDELTASAQENDPEDILSIFDPPVVNAATKINLTDVNSHSLGVIVRSAREQRLANSIVIPNNTPLPTSRTKVFGTEAANQRVVRVLIVEGETRDPRGCTQIGECVIRDLPKGLPQHSPVEVTFHYDKSGRIHVRASETTTHVAAEATLTRESGFDPLTLEELTNAVSQLTVE